MAIPTSLVMDWQTSNVYYLSNSTNVNLIGGGPSAASGESIPSSTNRRANYSANSVVQIGTKIYSWVGPTINRHDLLEPSAGWTEIHSFGTPNQEYVKSGLFNATVNGVSYLIGMYNTNLSGRIFGFRINLETEVVEESAVFITGATNASYGFKSSCLYRGNLFALFGLTPKVVIYDPDTNLCYATTIEPTLATNDARCTLITY